MEIRPGMVFVDNEGTYYLIKRVYFDSYRTPCDVEFATKYKDSLWYNKKTFQEEYNSFIKMIKDGDIFPKGKAGRILFGQ